MKSIHKDLESSVISSGQLSATSNKNKNKLKKIVSSLLGKRRNKKMRLEKSTIKIQWLSLFGLKRRLSSLYFLLNLRLSCFQYFSSDLSTKFR